MANKPRASRGSWFRQTGPKGRESRADLDKLLQPHERAALKNWHWEIWGRDEQLPPAGEWRVWLICAGRGFGKTRAGAEWVRNVARHDPAARIALVAASMAEARSVMVEGESGILAASPGTLVPEFEPSLRRLTWPNGAQAFLYSAAEPDTLRGPQHTHAWCDEIAKWENAGRRALAAWDNLQMGMRLGDFPRVLATSTPRRVALMLRLQEEANAGDVVVAKGRTADNTGVLPLAFYRTMLEQYSGSTQGRQELDGELLVDTDGALWNRALLERCRYDCARDGPVPHALRTVVAVDPPVSDKGDACGIVVAMLGADGLAWVLADCTVEKATPERWARDVVDAARVWHADRVVVEKNQGGQMAESVLRGADAGLPIKLVHAVRGKTGRAEPISLRYTAGKVRHAGMFAELEDQLCGMMNAGRYEGPGRSPDRADALVWALTELLLGVEKMPRVRVI